MEQIYKIKDKQQLDEINQTLKISGDAKTDNAIAEMAKKLPAKAQEEVFRHLSYIDAYYKKYYETHYNKPQIA